MWHLVSLITVSLKYLKLVREEERAGLFKYYKYVSSLMI